VASLRFGHNQSSFLHQHADSVTGTLSGWDRLRFRGTLRMLANVDGLGKFLSFTGRLFKDFKHHAHSLSQQVREAALAVAQAANRPVVHLDSPSVCKEDLAREIAQRDGVIQGLIATFTAVESCNSFNIQSNHQTGHLDLASKPRKCQHVYHYQIHPVFGFMHTRLQTWLPFNITVNINGREWLGRQMDAAAIAHTRHENCFPWVSDFVAAQKLLDQQVSFDWATALGDVGRIANPVHQQIVGKYNIPYYWSLDQSEWATDVSFRSQKELGRLYPSLIRLGIESFGCKDVMRFLGRQVDKGITPRFSGEIITDFVKRPEGACLKYRVNRNSVKMYDKAGCVLRVETTLNDVRDIQTPRVIEGKKVYKRMRKGVADIGQRAEVSAASNRRYIHALSKVKTPTPLKTVTQELSRPTRWKKQSVRGLNLLGDEDATLLESVGRGEFLINGFRNRDLQALLFAATPKDETERRKRSGQVTRKFRMLRAHGLIQKLPHTHRYLVSDKGREVITAIHAARESNIEKLSIAA
jgi:hypothetical protein